MDSRLDFLEFFLAHGISRNEMINMTDAKFQDTLNTLLDHGVPPHSTNHVPSHPRNAYLNDGFGNGGLSEEEAYRKAIEESLDEMLIAPHLRQPPDPRDEILHDYTTISEKNIRGGLKRVTGIPKDLQPKPTPLPQTNSRTGSKRAVPRVVADNKNSKTHINPQKNTGRTNLKRVPASSTKKTDIRKQAGQAVTNIQPQNSSKQERRSDHGSSYGKRQTAVSKANFETKKQTSNANSRVSAIPNEINYPSARNAISHFPDIHSSPRPARQIPSAQRKNRIPSARIKATNIATKKVSNISHEARNIKTPKGQQTFADKMDAIKKGNHTIAPIPDDFHVNSIPAPKPMRKSKLEEINQLLPDIPRIETHAPDYLDEIVDDCFTKKESNNQNLLNPPTVVDSPKQKIEGKKEEFIQPLRESQAIRMDQDYEYLEALQLEEERQRRAEMSSRRKEQAEEEMEQKLELRAETVAKAFAALPPEPSVGPMIAVLLSGGRIMRRFAPNEPANDIFTWVAGSSNGTLFLDSFDLMMGGGSAVDSQKTVEENNIKGRVMLNIVEK